jgi:hypothetical protein
MSLPLVVAEEEVEADDEGEDDAHVDQQKLSRDINYIQLYPSVIQLGYQATLGILEKFSKIFTKVFE